MKRININILAVSALFFTISCDRDEDLFSIGNAKGPSLSDIIHFTELSTDPPIADSVTPVIIKLRISPEAMSTKTDVRLVTSLGTFPNNDTAIILAANSTGALSTSLTSNKAGLAKIRASVATYSLDTSVVFHPASPEDMILVADKYVFDTSEDATITASLFRDTGAVSDPIKVFFTVMPDLPSVPPLLITPFANSNDKQATALITNPYGTQGWFTVSAATLHQNGDTLRKSLRIRVD
jgi:acid phosphatase family membrane protein YuiD